MYGFLSRPLLSRYGLGKSGKHSERSYSVRIHVQSTKGFGLYGFLAETLNPPGVEGGGGGVLARASCYY